MSFVATCFDRPGSAPAVRSRTQVTGAMPGLLYIIDVESYEDARPLIEEEPLHRAGLFELMTVRGWVRQLQESHA